MIPPVPVRRNSARPDGRLHSRLYSRLRGLIGRLTDVPLSFWIGFNLFVLAMLALDLGVFNRKAHVVTIKEAGAWTAVWVSLALLFNVGLYVVAGPQAGLEFLTGYLIEYSLSVDNIFVFVLIFSAFAVPCGATQVPAPRPLLGHPGRAGYARRDDRARRGLD